MITYYRIGCCNSHSAGSMARDWPETPVQTRQSIEERLFPARHVPASAQSTVQVSAPSIQGGFI
jgi:hypothetical protein